MFAWRAVATPTVLGGAPRAAPPRPPRDAEVPGGPPFAEIGEGRCVRYQASAMIAASTISAITVPKRRPRRETESASALFDSGRFDDGGSSIRVSVWAARESIVAASSRGRERHHATRARADTKYEPANDVEALGERDASVMSVGVPLPPLAPATSESERSLSRLCKRLLPASDRRLSPPADHVRRRRARIGSAHADARRATHALKLQGIVAAR